jgi:hypothetical protein
MKFSTVAAAAAITMLAGAASAATYSYNFSGFPANGETRDVASTPAGGPTLTITGDYYTIDGSGAYSGSGSPDVETNSWGLISDNYKDCNNYSRSDNVDCGSGEHAIDSAGPEGDEAMVFSFTEAVRLTSITISWYSGMAFDVIAGSSLFETIALNSYDSTSPAGYTFLFDGTAPELVGSLFAIGTRTIQQCSTNTRSYNGWNNNCTTRESYIKIRGITVETIDQPQVVPLPAAGWLMLAGFGGLAAMRRRKKAA